MHQPVLLYETIDFLLTDPGGIYVDCTVGGGGHLARLLRLTNRKARVVAIDKDAKTLAAARKKLDSPQVSFVHGDFRRLALILQELDIAKVHGVMLDLGVSSTQLDTVARGFSYHEDAPLDMRMDTSQALNAKDVVNRFPESELTSILYRYGEERYARNIARSIVRRRREQEISTTLELADIIRSAVPARYSREKHPARRSFQALRIAVNNELDALEEVLPAALDHLVAGGRLCVISFHSLEDRMVKRFMRKKAGECVCPPGSPVCTCGCHAELKVLTRKPVLPGDEERDSNPRARSAKLRAAEKL